MVVNQQPTATTKLTIAATDGLSAGTVSGSPAERGCRDQDLEVALRRRPDLQLFSMNCQSVGHLRAVLDVFYVQRWHTL